MINEKHIWVTFYNPRNGKIRIDACTKCGLAKDPRAHLVGCEVKTIDTHGMTKMGWEELPKYA